MHVVASGQISVVCCTKLEQCQKQQDLLGSIHHLCVICGDKVLPNVERTGELRSKRFKRHGCVGLDFFKQASLEILAVNAGNVSNAENKGTQSADFEFFAVQCGNALHFRELHSHAVLQIVTIDGNTNTVVLVAMKAGQISSLTKKEKREMNKKTKNKHKQTKQNKRAQEKKPWVFLQFCRK